MTIAPGAQPMFVDSAAMRNLVGSGVGSVERLTDAQVVFCGDRFGEHDPAPASHAFGCAARIAP